MTARFRAAGAALFFRHFFRLLVLAISAAEWACVAWVLMVSAGHDAPFWVHGAGLAAVHAFNLWLVAPPPRPRRPPSLAFRVYAAGAFAALFCALFLLFFSGVWWATIGVASQLQAMTVAMPVPDADAAFGTPFKWMASCGMTTIAVTFAYGYLFGHRRLRVSHVHLDVQGTWAAERPLKIVHLSDIHLGQNLPVGKIETFVASVNELDPDLVCITGDIIDGPGVDYGRYLPTLGKLRARGGVIAILGNHDHRAGADEVVAALQQWTSFHILRDEALTLRVAGTPLYVIGLDDRGRDWARGLQSDARLDGLMAKAPAGVPVVLLAHRPDIFPQAVEHDIPLTLAGHTHGGQIALPWFGGRRRNLAEFITRFPRGLYERSGHHLNVSCGVGVTSQPIRLFTPREITAIHLSTSDART